MKRILLYAVVACLAAACTAPGHLKLRVFNPLEIERVNETVEIPWDSLAVRIAALSPDSVAVFDTNGAEIPSQVIYNGADTPQALIFQATTPGLGHSEYTVRKAPRGQYKHMAFGRYVPESKDDYAWENNLVAYRIYGPAMESELVSPGIDVWVKSTEEMVIDNWYDKGDFYHNHGEGLDAYKVGVSLGGGASAPLVDEKLWLSRNYAAWETVDNGPVRTTVRLNYAPYDVGGRRVALTKYVSLDANTRFSRMTDYYTSELPRMAIAAGMPLHDGARMSEGEGWIALTEPASELQDATADGDISIGVLMPGVTSAVETDGHWLLVGEAAAGRPFVYWSGTGWSRAGIADDEAWKAVVRQQMQRIDAPLKVYYEK